MAGINVIGDNVLDAVRSVMTCSPDYLVMGMSSITFSGGMAGADAFQGKIEREAGVSVSIGSHSSTAALKAYGGVKRGLSAVSATAAKLSATILTAPIVFKRRRMIFGSASKQSPH